VLRRALLLLSITLLVLGCPEPEPEPEPLDPGCGDGDVTSIEECDDSLDNSDSAPDACRTDCTLPTCGDGVVDSGETCDDGGPFGGDGCSPTCAVESGRLEAEPNDDLSEAEPLASGESVVGGLPADDVDCYALEVSERGYVRADVAGEEPGSCPVTDARLRLFSPEGAQVAVAGPTLEEGCSTLDPGLQPGARFMPGGTWTLCVEGSWGEPVWGYTLTVEIGDDTCDLPEAPFTSDSDTDGDGTVDACDEDDDNDGLLDEDDNCPTVPNAGDVIPLATNDDDGLMGDWLLAGPYTGYETTESCRPSEDQILDGGDDGAAVPALGTFAGDGQAWFVASVPGRINFLNFIGGPTDREVYAAAWIRSDFEQTVTVALGPDDGAFLWLNGEQILDISGCQGTHLDEFTTEGTLLEGWNSILIKVRDHGGAWAMFFRFLDGDGEPLTGYEVSLAAGAPWAPDQTDTDGDGLGDVCDSTPAGPDPG
jgi:cysteine-rich repeat protein